MNKYHFTLPYLNQISYIKVEYNIYPSEIEKIHFAII